MHRLFRVLPGQAIKKFFQKLWERLSVVNWLGAILSGLRLFRKPEDKIDPKYLAIKPRALSDQRLLQAVSGLKAVLAFVPPTALAGAVLSLGEIGFQIWKRFALNQEYSSLKFPPADPNVIRFHLRFDPELSKHFGYLTLKHNWDENALREGETVFNDFSFFTDPVLLSAKYPQVSREYIEGVTFRNTALLNSSLQQIKQEILKASLPVEIDHNLRDGLSALMVLFPAMRNWALMNSDTFNEVLDMVDTVV